MKCLDVATIKCVAEAARDTRPVSGHTHNYYRYPARFSPQFAAAAIEQFSEPGDLVLDPYMGGATTVLEAMIAGRRAVGSDINQLAVFVAQTKVSVLSEEEEEALAQWADAIVPGLRCNTALPVVEQCPHNMTLPQVRWLRKVLSLLMASVDTALPSESCRRFARCVLLNVGQWALNGRKRVPTAAEFRERVVGTTHEMLASMSGLRRTVALSPNTIHQPLLRENDAECLDRDNAITAAGVADLVVTSPPYPGIHMLYHRWQVDGRKESDAPYWIAGCNDGAGASFYNFADRRKKALHKYFEKAERSFSAVRRVMRSGAVLVQMVAFSDRESQLRSYLDMMKRTGFIEVRDYSRRRIWREVPSRRWHAASKGHLPSSKEVVLIHLAN